MNVISERSQKLGTENAFVVLAEVDRLILQGRDVISFCIGQPDFKTPKNIRSAAIKAIEEGKHGYTPSSGILELRRAVASYILRTRGITVNPDHVVIGAGAKPFIMYSILATTDYGQGHEVIYPNPGFPIYESQIRAMGALPIPVDIHQSNNFSLSASALESKITEKTRLIILNSPHNPTGGIITQEDMEKLAKVFRNHPKCWIFADEIYSQLCYDDDFVSLTQFADLRDRIILADGVSKTWAMTGWRLGFAINEALSPIFSKWVTNTESCASQISQWAAVEALDGSQDEADRMRVSFEQRRNLIVKLLNSLPGFDCPTPGGSFYVWPNITEACRTIGCENSEEFRKRLLNEYGVAVLADVHFGNRISNQSYIRFSYATSTENIKGGIAKIREFLDQNTK